MAKRLGAFDLRCDEAVLSAMLAHPRHGKRPEFLEWGEAMVRAGNWAFARHMPVEIARRAFDAERENIARRQSKSGLWFKKNGNEWSRPIVAALRHAGLLDKWLASGTLRPIPKLPAIDPAAILKRQSPDGSWDGAVAVTALEVERLLALGVNPGSPALSRAGKWLLAQFQDTYELDRSFRGRTLIVKNVFVTDGLAEYHATQEGMRHMDICRSCCQRMATIPTSLCLCALIMLGHGGDSRVEKCYKSLLDLRVGPGEKLMDSQAKLGRFGSWCAHQVTFKLEDRIRAEGKKAISSFPV